MGSRGGGGERMRARSGEFVFGFIFDVHSHLPRKNPAAVIEAFRRVFTWQGRIRLVLKSVNAAADPAGYAALRRLARNAPIDFIDGYWRPEEIHDLMAACDAYVSLHRSEGFGRGIAEAMMMGKPVIVTGHSGNMDFTTPGTAALIVLRYYLG